MSNIKFLIQNLLISISIIFTVFIGSATIGISSELFIDRLGGFIGGYTTTFNYIVIGIAFILFSIVLMSYIFYSLKKFRENKKWLLFISVLLGFITTMFSILKIFNNAEFSDKIRYIVVSMFVSFLSFYIIFKSRYSIKFNFKWSYILILVAVIVLTFVFCLSFVIVWDAGW